MSIASWTSAEPAVAPTPKAQPKKQSPKPRPDLRIARPTSRPEFRPHTVGRCMAEVAPTEVRWLWPGKIPRGRLTVFAGDGGVGKSFASLAVAATVSRGGPWPDRSGECERAAVVLLSAEDDPSDTIRVRLDRCEADCRYIHIIEGVQRQEKEEPGYFDLATDLGPLAETIERTAAKLCIVDPIGAYLPSIDSHKDAQVRSVLGPLAALASRTDCAVVVVLHLNKAAASAKVSARVTGSLAFTNSARMAWLVIVDPENDRRRLILPYKFNIVESPSGIAFEIVDGGVTWFAETVHVDADAILARDSESRRDRNEIQEWLQSLLVHGPMPVTEIKKAAEADCHAWRTVERAKKDLGIRSDREGFGRKAKYLWSLGDSEVAPVDSEVPF